MYEKVWYNFPAQTLHPLFETFEWYNAFGGQIYNENKSASAILRWTKSEALYLYFLLC